MAQQRFQFFPAGKGFPAMANNVSPVPSRWGRRRHVRFHVSLPSGRGETISVSRDGTVAELKIAAQQSLGKGFLRLASPDGCLLDPLKALRHYELQYEDGIAAIAQQPKRAATATAFALRVGENAAVTWGDRRCGADSSRVQNIRMFSRFVAHSVLLLPFWQTEAW